MEFLQLSLDFTSMSKQIETCRWMEDQYHSLVLPQLGIGIGAREDTKYQYRMGKSIVLKKLSIVSYHLIYTGIQLDTSPIAKCYRKLCGAITIFAFVARLATKTMIYVDIININPHYIS